jgi:hypothetical protein
MGPELTVRVASLWLGEDGIVRIIHVPGAIVSLEDAQETMAAYLTINKGMPRRLLVDTRTLTSLSREARKYYAGEDAAKVACAAAIIVGTPVSRVSGNFYLGLASPHLPSRLFQSEDDALEWLKGYL